MARFEQRDPEEIMTKGFGTLQPLNPNLLAGYLIGTIPATLGCVFYDFKKTNLPEKIKRKKSPEYCCGSWLFGDTSCDYFYKDVVADT